MVRVRSTDRHGQERMDEYHANWSGWMTADGKLIRFKATITTEEHWIGAADVRFSLCGGRTCPTTLSWILWRLWR